MPERVEDITFREIKARVKKAIQNLKESDLYLFEHNASERSIIYRFAMWLEVEFLEWCVDCEYNLSPPDNWADIRARYADVEARRKEREATKSSEDEIVSFYPDIVVHQRGKKENLLVIEVRKSSVFEEIQFDITKLRTYRHDKNLEFKYALLIRFQNPQDDHGSIIDNNLSRWIE